VSFPDVALSFRVRDFKSPHLVLDKMAVIAEAIANHLGGELRTSNGGPFELPAAKKRLDRAVQEIRSFNNSR
jgi:hypothetical protein